LNSFVEQYHPQQRVYGQLHADVGNGKEVWELSDKYWCMKRACTMLYNKADESGMRVPCGQNKNKNSHMKNVEFFLDLNIFLLDLQT
jgi:hypothetical protein